ncbi:MAG: CoB--CoM heterodisulfide reductase iron-sulfur subunit B family protein [Candidatus Bathyarchaeota archaeon]|nr:MAG: CoB--CoM heterodisulfide reductase iron-sulfur subunit B family protein [Candidatus Bathyarchaeota archaeon]
MPEVRYLLFLGCVIPYRIASYEISARKVLAKLGVELVEMPEFNCCGLPLDPVEHDMMLVLAARNLAVAEQQNLPIMALCPGCAGTLRKVNMILQKDKKLKEKVNGYLKETGLEFKGTTKVKHIMQVLAEDVGFEKIKETVQNPLNQLGVTEHAGCHVLRPAKYIGFDDPENPTILKNLIELTGAKSLDYMDATECCGAPIIGVNDMIPLQLTREKLDHMREVGAQAVITVCPFCHMMFDINQPRIERVFNETFEIPVLHYTQLLGLAMGFSPDELALSQLRVDTSEILKLL